MKLTWKTALLAIAIGAALAWLIVPMDAQVDLPSGKPSVVSSQSISICIAAYLDAADSAQELYWLAPDSEKQGLIELAATLHDAGELIFRQPATYAQFCSSERLVQLTTLTAANRSRHDGLEAAQQKTRAAIVQRALDRALTKPAER